MDRATKYNARQNKSVRERQIPYDFAHMWNLRNKIDIREGRKRERETNHERLLKIENKLRVNGESWVGYGLDG